MLLNTYYGTAHNSQPNYVAQISGQGPNPQTQADCQGYSSFVGAGTASPGQAVGQGCVFPATVRSLPTQLDSARLTWKGYMEDMGAPCRHPALNAPDPTQQARVGDQYAARHNPFVYFAAITGSRECAQRVVDLGQLPKDLTSVATTPSLSYITPNLCDDGHDTPCVDGRPGGPDQCRHLPQDLGATHPRLSRLPEGRHGRHHRRRVRRPADRRHGMLQRRPLTQLGAPGISGLGGGLVGALVLSRWTTGGTWSTTPYNHYALLASLEDLFHLPYLGNAQAAGLNRFGLDVYNSGWDRSR